MNTSPVRPADSERLIERLVERHGSVLLGYLVRLTGDRQRAEDIYQETLIRAWKHPDACRACLEAGPGWLITVARNVSIDQLRAAAARPATVADESGLARIPDPDNQVNKMLLAREVRAAVGALSAAHREVVLLMYMQDMSAAQIAERLGLPVGTVKSRSYYALRALRDALAARGLDHTLAATA
jgi:RNA polymerase sigma-70 factor, ECF subfamily